MCVPVPNEEIFIWAKSNKTDTKIPCLSWFMPLWVCVFKSGCLRSVVFSGALLGLFKLMCWVTFMCLHTHVLAMATQTASSDKAKSTLGSCDWCVTTMWWGNSCNVRKSAPQGLTAPRETQDHTHTHIYKHSTIPKLWNESDYKHSGHVRFI